MILLEPSNKIIAETLQMRFDRYAESHLFIGQLFQIVLLLLLL